MNKCRVYWHMNYRPHLFNGLQFSKWKEKGEIRGWAMDLGLTIGHKRAVQITEDKQVKLLMIDKDYIETY